MLDDIVCGIAGIEPGSKLAETIARRADIFELTQKTHDAALTPADPGGLSHGERAALACRVARLNDDADFEAHFRVLVEKAGASDAVARIANISFRGEDGRTKALIRHVDLLARDPKSATRKDVELLKTAGISEADIVRLSELVAFVSYQIRVVSGLKLMRARP